MTTRMLVVSTLARTISAFLIPHVKMMQREGWIVDAMAAGISENKTCTDTFAHCHEIEWSRSPMDIHRIVESYKKVQMIVKAGKYDIVHVHTPIASAVTRFALRRIAKEHNIKIIYTAHGFHFYKGAPLLNWLVYYPIEKYLSRYTDVLITINKEDYALAKGKMYAKRTEYVPGVGVDIEKIQNVTVDRDKKRAELGIPKDSKMLLSVGELSKRKNHEVVIRVLAELKDKNIIYAICGRGPLEAYLKDLANNHNIADRVFFLGFRTDVIEICKSSDLFVFPSLQEGLPVALMEAMACGLPVVCSAIRGNLDLVIDGINGYFFDPYKFCSLSILLNKTIRHPLCPLLKCKDEFEAYSQRNVLQFMNKIYKDYDFKWSYLP